MADKPVLLVTGAGRGIGAHLARHYAGGFHVIGCSRHVPEGGAPEYEHHALDVGDESQAVALFRDIRRRHGRLDVLINNAGVAAMNHAILTPASTVENVLATNVLGTFVFCREAARIMRQRRFGRIVNVSTVATRLNIAGEAIYAAAKSAVEKLTQVLAHELAVDGITVNAVAPTPIQTDLIRSVPPDRIAAVLDRQAIRRLGEFRDVANVIDFFIKPESDFITGQVLFLGGVC